MTLQGFNPKTGQAFGPTFTSPTKAEVDTAINLITPLSQSPAQRSAMLRTLGAELESARAEIIAIATQESGLPEARLNGELTRTIFQVNTFADYVASGEFLNAKIDKADPNYGMGPRPDIRKINRPIGIVAVFAASNFPLAFSTAGGDSISALAAGNAVVLKAHPSHPNTSQMVFECIQRALAAHNVPAAAFTMIQGDNPEITRWVAEHPHVNAIGFTGSTFVGKLLVDIAAKRPIPIPVYAEMGAINPMFVTSSAIKERGAELVKGSVDSVLLGSGQFCTKPGLIFVPKEGSEEFISSLKEYLATLSVGQLLNKSIAERYSLSISQIAASGKVEVYSGLNQNDGFGVTPTIFVASWDVVKNNHELLEEHFGPTSVVVIAEESEYSSIPGFLEGQLTATIQGTESDDVASLVESLSQRVGRVIWNGFPTGVSVTPAMQHGGPWPASSIDSTSVGRDSIYRFMRPVAYQNMPQQLLPEGLQDSNPWSIPQELN